MRSYLTMAIFLGLSISGVAQNAQGGKSNGTQCIAFPCVVASVNLTNQTTAVFQVPIYTPTTSGMFRVDYYETSDLLRKGSWSFEWNWTDDLTTRSFGPFHLPPGEYFNAGVPSMWVAAGHPITYSVKPTADDNVAGSYT